MDCRVCFEDVLGSIPVVDIPIHNENALSPELCLSRPRGDCGVIKKTASHGLVLFSMMPRWSYRTEDVAHLTSENLLHGKDNASGRMKCHLERF